GFASAAAAADRRAGSARADRKILDPVVEALPAGRTLLGRDPALAHHAQGTDLRADRRHHRRADHVVAGAARRNAQLGLSVLLAARRDAHAPRIDECRLSGGGAVLA